MTPEQVELPDHAELTTDQARQGETGHHVRYVLAVGIGLVIVAFALAVMIVL
jgi:hypothetical protein